MRIRRHPIRLHALKRAGMENREQSSKFMRVRKAGCIRRLCNHGRLYRMLQHPKDQRIAGCRCARTGTVGYAHGDGLIQAEGKRGCTARKRQILCVKAGLGAG